MHCGWHFQYTLHLCDHEHLVVLVWTQLFEYYWTFINFSNDLYNLIWCFRRYVSESFKALESEMSEMRSSRNEICFESKNIINYVRSWMLEQKKINEYVVNKERNYCVTIEKLRQENEYVLLKLCCMVILTSD